MVHADREAVLARSAESSRTTHAAPECLDACRLFGAILHQALSGADKDAILFGHGADGLATENVQAIARGDWRDKTEKEIKGSGYVVRSLEAALWCFLHTDSFESAVLKATNLGDDADTTAAIVGQVAGAFYGEAGIPARWLARLAMREEIGALALGLMRT